MKIFPLKNFPLYGNYYYYHHHHYDNYCQIIDFVNFTNLKHSENKLTVNQWNLLYPLVNVGCSPCDSEPQCLLDSQQYPNELPQHTIESDEFIILNFVLVITL